MKARFTAFLLVALSALILLPPAFAQFTVTVKGTVKDEQGKPMPGATIEFVNNENGQKYNLKTNGTGQYFSLGIMPGKYKVTLINDGKPIFFLTGVPVGTEQVENTVDIDLQKERALQQQQGAAPGGKGQPPAPPQMTEEQKKKIEEAQKEQMTVKQLNEKLAEASQAQTSGNYDQAVQILTQATQMDATRDVLWAKLGDASHLAASKKPDRQAKMEDYAQEVEAYQKAIQIKPSASYYNNLGGALGKSGKADEAVKAYTTAAQLDPTHVALYYFNIGGTLTNAGRVDEATQAFDKAIAADPNYADAYYQKGVNLLNKATIGKDGKMIAPPGTAEALNKYLELKPDGQFAEPAKQLLTQMGASIETSFGKAKKKSK